MVALPDLQEVHKAFSDNEVPNAASLIIERGQVTCVCDPSGSAKRTHPRGIS